VSGALGRDLLGAVQKVYYANRRKDAAKNDFDDDFIYCEVVALITRGRLR
jgi:hypothetical protein